MSSSSPPDALEHFDTAPLGPCMPPKNMDVVEVDRTAMQAWAHLLEITCRAEARLRGRLRQRFDMSHGRFACLAQLHRFRKGLTMRALSRCLMVTGGHVTGLAHELQTAGLVVFERSSDDKRQQIVRLTPEGRRTARATVREHDRWVLQLFEGFDTNATRQLYHQLGALHVQLVRANQRSKNTA